MDVLADLLQRARAHGAVFAVSVCPAPWGLLLDDELPLGVHVALDGPTWVCVDGELPVCLQPGDLALVAAGRPHRLGSAPDVAVRTLDQVRAHRAPGEADVFVLPGDGPVSRVLCGAYRFHGDLCAQLVAAIPDLLVVRAGDLPHLRGIVDVMVDETSSARPGRSVVLDRLLDVVLVEVVRWWFDRSTTDAPAWYRALHDPQIGAALRMIHETPGRAWTVPALARDVGLSRATLARRFHELVGVPPATYLTEWRMRVAAEQLRDSDDDIGRIGRALGYTSDAAFSAAFRRIHGQSPSAARAAARRSSRGRPGHENAVVPVHA
jgi:AraC-like DNA-binding protein